MSQYPRPGVYVSESLLPSTSIQTSASADAAGAAVGTFPKGPTTLTLVQSWYDFTSIYGGLDVEHPSTYSVQSFFLNGGRDLYVLRLLSSDAAKAAVIIPKDGDITPAVTFAARNAGTEGNALRITIAPGTSAGLFDISVSEEVAGSSLIPREFFADLSMAAGSSVNVATVINVDSKYVTATVNDALAAPDQGTFPLVSGTTGTAVGKTTYVPVSGANVFASLSVADRPLVLFLPSLHSNVTLSADRAVVYSAAVAWAEANYGFVVVDTPSGLTSAEAVTYISEVTPSSHAAVYWPNVLVKDPLGHSRSSLRYLAPSGAVAGLYLSTDATRGVFKAPAGLEANVANVVSLEKSLSSADLDALYAGKVNAIRNVPGSGPVVMGARTLKTERTADSNVSVRRTLLFLEKALKDATEFAIFENNNADLWARLTTVCSVLVGDLWRAGGLSGSTETAAFYVKCDAENNPFSTVQNGEVHIEVGVAVQYPAEFIVIRLSQQAGV